MSRLNMCPLFIHCHAPICPLDPYLSIRVHQDGDAACYYLTEYVKQGGMAILKVGLAQHHYQAIESTYPKIIALHPPIKRQLARSSNNALRYSTELEGAL